MSSRKEEERNEKIIRGLMKLPPNRRCINCNGLGPQYVCTNFWTFVCVTCSGIHREFTHRVKSVSMAKFTSQEVEALQKGGNQRAREIYLKDWDSQRLRLADNSNADKIREFIKNVYIDKKFVGGMSSDRPPRDSQKLSSHEEEIRRASSYHSYSQSPPYDFQYEERRYGKHAPVLSRKPGSDRGLYYGKFSSFLSPSRLSDRSPSNFSDHMHEDGFANERSNSMISNYSASSGGDPFRSGVQSPNFQKEIGSPSSETSRDFSGEDVVNYTGNAYPDSFARRDGGRMSRPQRTAFSGSFGSFDSDSLSFKSINPVGLVDVAPGPEPVKARYNSTSTLPSFPQSSIPGNSDGLDLFSLPCAPKNVASTTSDKEISNLPGNSDGLDLFNASYAQQNVTSASTINMSHVPGLSTAQSLDLFGPSPISTTPTFISHQLAQSIPPASLDLFSEMPRQQPAANFTEKTSDVLVPQNEGWATFDMPQHSAPVGTKNSASATIPSSNDNSVIDPLASLSRWPSFQDISAHTSSSAQTLWSEASEYVKAMTNTASTESWNAFEDSTGQLPGQNVHKSGNQNALHHPSTSDQYLSLNVAEEFKKDGSQNVAVDSVHLMPSVSSHISMTPDDLSILPVTAGIHSYPVDHKSTNPFELPYDLETECDNTSQFWDISSLQAALPNGPSLTSFTSVTNQPWFPQDPMAPYASEGTLGFMAAQASSTHLSTVPAQGPVASIGGNPFAL